MAKTRAAKNGACPKCGAGLVNLPTGSGSVCPAGCGGLHNVVDPETSRASVRAYKISLLPKARKVACLVAARKDGYLTRDAYTLDGCEGVYRRVRRESASLEKPSSRDAVIADCDGTAIELALWAEAHDELKIERPPSDSAAETAQAAADAE